jgi:hypothetical protein
VYVQETVRNEDDAESNGLVCKMQFDVIILSSEEMLEQKVIPLQ